MAPKLLKRPAAANQAEKQKKQKTLKDCKSISAALSGADLPRSVSTLLKTMVPHALSTYAEDRHEFQAKAIDFVGDVLAGIQASLKDAANQAQAKVDGAAAEKVNREKAVVDAAKELAGKESEVATRTAAVVELDIAHGKASDKLKTAQNAAKEPTAEFEKLIGKKMKLQKLIETSWPPIKSGVDKSSITDFSKSLDTFGVDSTLVGALHYALGKEPDARADFDILAINNLDGALAAKMKAMDEEIGAAEPQKTIVTKAMEIAQAEEGTAKEALVAAKAAVTAGAKEVKAAKDSLDAAHLALKCFGKDAAKDMQALTDAQKKAAEFSEGPMTAFKSLKEMSKPAPAPVEGQVEDDNELRMVKPPDGPMVRGF